MANGRTDSITIAELSAGCNRVRQLEDRYGANVILESLRPLAGLSFTSVVIRTAERVAAVDRKLGSHCNTYRTDMLAESDRVWRW